MFFQRSLVTKLVVILPISYKYHWYNYFQVDQSFKLFLNKLILSVSKDYIRHDRGSFINWLDKDPH